MTSNSIGQPDNLGSTILPEAITALDAVYSGFLRFGQDLATRQPAVGATLAVIDLATGYLLSSASAQSVDGRSAFIASVSFGSGFLGGALGTGLGPAGPAVGAAIGSWLGAKAGEMIYDSVLVGLDAGAIGEFIAEFIEQGLMSFPDSVDGIQNWLDNFVDEVNRELGPDGRFGLDSPFGTPLDSQDLQARLDVEVAQLGPDGLFPPDGTGDPGGPGGENGELYLLSSNWDIERALQTGDGQDGGSLVTTLAETVEIITDLDGIGEIRLTSGHAGVGTVNLAGNWGLLLFGSSGSLSADQLNGLDPVWALGRPGQDIIMVGGPLEGDVFATPYTWGATQTRDAGSGIILFEVAGTNQFRAVAIIEGFSNGDFGMQLAGYGGGGGSRGVDRDSTLPPLTHEGGVRDDDLTGSSDNDDMFGGSGDDNLQGAEGNDTLVGGYGNDIIEGGLGNDTYFFAAGDGTDIITDSGGSNDRLVLEGLNFNEVTLFGSSSFSGHDDLVIWAIDGSIIFVSDHFKEGADNSIEEIEFSDGLILDLGQIEAASADPSESFAPRRSVTEYGTFGDDDYYSNGARYSGDVIDVGPGNDIVRGKETADTIYGGTGNDYLWGASGNDFIYGEAGDDTLVFGGYVRGSGTSVFHGGGGNDTLEVRWVLQSTGWDVDLQAGTVSDRSGDYVGTLFEIENVTTDGASYLNNNITGSDVANRLEGGGGDDALFGQNGDDILIGGSGADSFDGGNGTDTVSYTTAGAAVYVHMGDTAQNTGDALGDSYTSIEVLEGSAFDDTLIGDAILFRGGAGNDSITAYNVAGVEVHGGAGNDGIYTSSGNDTVIGGAGDDTTITYEGDDLIILGDGDDYAVAGTENDTVLGEAGSDELYGGAGNDNLSGGSGNDSLFGDEGDDVIDFGTGDDFANGGIGNDTFIFKAGYGSDSIGDFSGGAGAGDVIEFQGSPASDFTALQSYMNDWGGPHTFIDFGNGDVVTLYDTAMASLHADDFRFVA